MPKSSKLKTGLRHPKRALYYILHGQKEYQLDQAEKMEHYVKPKGALEAHMVKRTDIHEHLATLNMLTIELGLKTVLELGTGTGESTVAFLDAAKQIGGRVYSIDIDPSLEAHATINANGLKKYWTFIQGSSLEVKWNRPINHLFVDTIHTYGQVIRELKKYEPYVKRGGLITLHDTTTWPGVMRAVNTYLNDKPSLRIYKYFNNNGLAVIFKGRKH
ncbi:MAG: class I SAM-dependent methyltransferase [Methanobacteriota archaeon]